MYTGYLIANFNTGFDQERQPWLLPDDAQFELLDGYVYRGVWQKREGYSQFATGEKDVPYCESRMVHRIVNENKGNGTGIVGPYNKTATNKPIRRGTFTIESDGQILVDNGLGVLSGDGTGTINYTTGAANFTFNAATAVAIFFTYDYHPGLPVMAVMNFYTQSNTQELILCDTKYVNKYDNTINRLEDISPATAFTGDNHNFFSWVNYSGPDGLQRLLFVNNKDQIHQYSGSAITPYPVYTASNQQTGVAYGTGDGTVGPYNFTTPVGTGIVPGTITITAGAQVVTDDSFGILIGNGSGTVDYLSGTVSVTFSAAVPLATAITIDYKQLTDAIDTALHIYQFKDRLVIHYTTEGGTIYGRRIRISGTGAFSDIFTSDAIGAGFIDIPNQSFISSGDFNRDDLIIFTQQETWVQQYTGNDIVPFTINRIDESRGSKAPYGTITYLNRTSAESPRGLIISDGYSVVRADDKIPDYSFNQIDQENFDLCFAGSVDEDRDHYLIHPSPDESASDKILVTNYEEDNYSVYRIPLSCMGNYLFSSDVTWDDLVIYPSWKAMSDVYGNWNAFSFSKGAPFAVGGGHQGQVVRLNVTEAEDYPVKIRNITIVDSETIQVTTDFQNWVEGDYVEIEDVLGMVEVNNKQGQISEVISNYVFNLVLTEPTSKFTAYTSGGEATKVIVFESTTKKLNPFVEQNQKIRCGWVYFYVGTTGTDLTANKYIVNATQSNPCELTIPNHGYNTGDQVYINGVQGMVELNDNDYYITVIDDETISLDDTDSTGFTPYTSAGFTSTPVDAELEVNIIVNDTEQITQVSTVPDDQFPYQINLTSQQAENGIKKWYKIWVNQVGRFIQFKFRSAQCGAKVTINAIMPGMAGIGRLI